MPTSPIYLHLNSEAPVGIGGSHSFGYPDLPPDFAIPTVNEDGDEFALTLVCQINLADLPDNDVLPKRGLLQFYADIAYYCGEWDEPAITMTPSNNKVCRVVFVPEDKLGELENTQDRYAEQDEIPAIALTADHNPPSSDESELQLLGTTEHLEWVTWPTPCGGWRLLLQMDSMEGEHYTYNFIDWGVLCFIINPADLQRLDFSNVRAIILST